MPGQVGFPDFLDSEAEGILERPRLAASSKLYLPLSIFSYMKDHSSKKSGKFHKVVALVFAFVKLPLVDE